MAPATAHVLAVLTRAGAAAALGATLLLGACASPAARTPAPPASASPASPGVRGAQSGLEMQWWIISDDDGQAEVVLAPFAARPTPLSDSARRLWHDNGIRVLSVPVGDVEALGRSLRPIGPVNRQWLGESPRWTDAVRGPVSRRPFGLDLDSGPLVLDPGRLRMLLRCWVVPSLWSDDAVAPGLRVELALQHVALEPARLDSWRRSAMRTLPAVDEEGAVFSRLTLEFVADPDHALILVPESPQAVWPATPDPATPSPSSQGPSPPEAPRRFGPRPASSPTLGEALLSLENPTPLTVPGDGTAASPRVQLARRTSKAIIVLVPTLPEGYSPIRAPSAE